MENLILPSRRVARCVATAAHLQFNNRFQTTRELKIQVQSACPSCNLRKDADAIAKFQLQGGV